MNNFDPRKAGSNEEIRQNLRLHFSDDTLNKESQDEWGEDFSQLGGEALIVFWNTFKKKADKTDIIVKETNEEQLERLKSELSQACSERDRLQNEHAQKQADLNNIILEKDLALQQAQTKLDDAKKQLDDLVAEHNSVQSKLDSSISLQDDAQKQFAALTAERNQIQQELHTAIEQRDDAQKQFTTLTAERDLIQQELHAAIEQRDDAQRQLDDLVAEHNSGQSKLDSSISLQDDAQRQFAALTAERNQIQQELHAAIEQRDDAQKQFTTLTAERDLIQQELHAAIEQRDDAQKQFATLTAERDLIQQELHTAIEQRDDAQRQLDDLVAEHNSVQSKLDSSISLRDDTQKQFAALTAERDLIQQELHTAIEQRNDAQKQFAALTTEHNQIQQKLHTAIEQRKNAEADLVKQMSTIREKLKTIDNLTREKERLLKKANSNAPRTSRMAKACAALFLLSSLFLGFINVAGIRLNELASFPWTSYMEVNAGNANSYSYLQLSRYYLSTGASRMKEYEHKAFSTCEKGCQKDEKNGEIWHELGCLHIDGHGPHEKNSMNAIIAGGECIKKAAKCGFETAKKWLTEFN